MKDFEETRKMTKPLVKPDEDQPIEDFLQDNMYTNPNYRQDPGKFPNKYSLKYTLAIDYESPSKPHI